MDVTLAGMEMVVSEEQERKAPSPMEMRLVPNDTDASAVHSPKASAPIETAPGKATELNEEQWKKADHPTSSTLVGKTTEVIPSCP
jgi:hypothetical protein